MDSRSDVRVGMLTSFPPMRCGIGDHVHEFLPYLARAGAQVEVLTYVDAHRGGRAPPQEGIHIHPALRRSATPWGVARELRRLVDDVRVDVLTWQTQSFLHPRQYNLAAPLLPRRVPLVVFAHDVPVLPRLVHASVFLRALYRRADLVIAHSDTTAKALVDLHGVAPERIREIPLGVDRTQFHPGMRSEGVREAAGWTHDDIVVLFLGFVNEGKGVFELLEGFAQAAREEPRLRLVIAGDDLPPGGGKRARHGVLDALRSRAADLGIADRVWFPGFVPKQLVGPWLASADILALPYHFSYQSAVLFKGMASGAAMLATDIDGFRSCLKDGETAMLVPPRDPGAIARALDRLAKDPALRERLRANAAAQAEREYDMGGLARRTLAILHEAVDLKSRP